MLKIDAEIILIIDDEDIVRSILCDMISSMGYHVIDFSDPMPAIEYYSQNFQNVVLVLFDMTMPRLNGRETFFLLKKINRDIRSVVLSGSELNEDIENILKEGCLDYLKKPVRLQSLEKVVNLILKREHSVKRFPVEMSGIKELVSIPDSNFEDALEGFGGKMELLFKMLGKFIENHSDAGKRMHHMVENGQNAELFIYAHSIKNISANLGLTGLMLLSEKIEKDSLDSDLQDIKAEIDVFDSARNDAFARLKTFLERHSAEVEPEPDLKKDIKVDLLIRYIEELLEYTVKNRPVQCLEIFNTKLKNVVCSGFGQEQKDDIFNSIKKYEFDSLSTYLGDTLKRLRGK